MFSLYSTVSAQPKLGPDRVEYDSRVVFSSNGPFKQIVYAPVVNDQIGWEDDEILRLALEVDIPPSGLNFSYLPISTTVVRIVDDDCKHNILIPIMGGRLIWCVL